MRKFKVYSNQLEVTESRSDDILFQAVFNDSPEAIFLLNYKDFTIYDCNNKAVELFQADSKLDLINLQSFNLYNSEPVEFSKNIIIQEINNGSEYKQELALKSLKGNVFWGSISKKILQHNEEKIIILRINKVIDYIKAAETLATLLKNTSKVTGELYFKKITELLATTFETKYCYVAKISDRNKCQAETIKFWSDNSEGKNFVFNYTNTPCENVINGYITFYPQNLQEMFPKDQFIANMGIESFIGAPIYYSNEEPMGMLVLMDDKEMQEKPNSRYVLSVFASRAGAELKRMNAEELLRKKTQELIKVNAMKDRFLKITAHDLKNPFNSIMGFSELLRRKIKNTRKDKIQKMVNIIDDSVKQTCSILDNLSDWSKTQRDVISFSPEKVDIAEISENISDYYKNYAQSKEIKIYSNINKNTYAYADNYMVKAIFRNLISNAVKYSNKKGNVTIDASVKDNNIEIEITDTGIGIDKTNIKELFRIDEKIIRPGTANESGSGVGLIICKDFIKRNNGSLSIDSVVNKGTKIHFTLPRFKD